MILITAVSSIWVLWVMYLACMNLMRARDTGTLTKPAYYFGLTVLYPGLLLDVLVNLFCVTAILLEIPKEWTVSSRVERHCETGQGWRKAVCLFFRLNLLAPFDTSGKHG